MGALLLVLVLFAVLAAGLAAIYVRLSPLQAFQDERTALFGAYNGRSRVDADEGEALLSKLRTLLKEHTDLLSHERSAREKLRVYLNEERIASQALCAQVNAGRFATEALCAQVNAERFASDALREELEVERLALLDALYHDSAPERVERAAQALKKSRALREAHERWARPENEKPAAMARDEETKREGASTFPAASREQRAAHTEQERERPTAFPATPEDFAVQSKLVAATAAGNVDVDSDGNETTRTWSSDALTQALEANAGDADGDEETRVLSTAAMAAALEAEAGGATRLPQTAPRALRSEAFAPPASASPVLSSEPAIKAAGLDRRPKSTPVATPPAPPQRTSTLVGIPTMRPLVPAEGTLDTHPSWPTLKHGEVGHSTHTSEGAAPSSPAPRVAKTLLSMQAQGAAPTFSPSDAAASAPERRGDRDTIESPPPFNKAPAGEMALERPMYAPRRSPSAEVQSGFDGVPEAASRRRLDPDEETPRGSRVVEQEVGK